MTKTQAAFVLSVQKLFSLKRPIYLWTFTFRKVLPDWWYSGAWRRFAVDFGNMYGRYICGMRVLEPHAEHGLHYHLLVDKRMSVHIVRRMGERYGFGRVHVTRADAGTALYLAKYLGKSGDKLHGCHRWGSFGAFEHVRKNAVEMESPYMDARRKLGVKGRVKIGVEDLMRRAFDVHGANGLAACWGFLREGRLMSACKTVSPNVIITEKGGLKYFQSAKAIKVKVVRGC